MSKTQKTINGIIPLLLIINLFLIVCPNAFAAIVTADSCSADDISDAVQQCLNSGGGTVKIPPCQAGSSWNDGDTVKFDSGNLPLRIKGSGKDSTIIGYKSGADGTMFNHTGGAKFAELSDMTLKGNNYDLGGGCF